MNGLVMGPGEQKGILMKAKIQRFSTIKMASKAAKNEANSESSLF